VTVNAYNFAMPVTDWSAAVNRLAGVGDFLRRQFGGASKMLATPAGGFDPGAAALRIQAALELRQCASNVKQQFALRGCGGVHSFGNRLKAESPQNGTPCARRGSPGGGGGGGGAAGGRAPIG
jgi:hypothetical protein